MPERHAIYYAPGVTDPLWAKAAEWLGRDPLGTAKIDGPVAGLSRDVLHERSISARRYGFHATIKAPMALADGQSREALEAALAAFAAHTPAVAIGPLQLALLDGFLALVPVRQSAELTGFASEAVVNFDRFRAPPSDAERARRMNGNRLTPRQVELIQSFGYPYVFEEFRFHMTLTDRLEPADRQPLMEAAAAHFGELVSRPLTLDRLVLFHEAEAGAPFRRGAEFLLEGK